MNDYNQIYGKFSSGTGNWLDEKLFSSGINSPYSNDIIDSYVTQVSIDLNRLSSLTSLKGKIVMDVGTGRQALALNKIGADFVDHFDISKNNINSFKKYLKKNKLKIASQCEDISDIKFANHKRYQRYDYIYLQGIIQHVKNPLQALKNLSFVCNHNGIIWLYYYQSGSLTHIYWDAIRYILGTSEKNLTFLYSHLKANQFSDKSVNIIMDNIGCTYRHLLDTSFYINVMKKNGFEQIMNKDIYDNTHGLNLRITTPACIAGFKKVSEIKSTKEKFPNSEYIDHFNSKYFRNEDKDLITKINSTYNKIKILINDETFNKSKLDLLNVALPLIKESLNYNISKPFMTIQENLIKSFNKSLVILKKIKEN